MCRTLLPLARSARVSPFNKLPSAPLRGTVNALTICALWRQPAFLPAIFEKKLKNPALFPLSHTAGTSALAAPCPCNSNNFKRYKAKQPPKGLLPLIQLHSIQYQKDCSMIQGTPFEGFEPERTLLSYWLTLKVSQ